MKKDWSILWSKKRDLSNLFFFISGEIPLDFTRPFRSKTVHFSEERIRSGAKKLIRNKNTAVQGRLDGFFKKVAKPAEEAGASNKKRKVLSCFPPMITFFYILITLPYLNLD